MEWGVAGNGQRGADLARVWAVRQEVVIWGRTPRRGPGSVAVSRIDDHANENVVAFAFLTGASREVANALLPSLPPSLTDHGQGGTRTVHHASKGLEPGTGLEVSEVIAWALGGPGRIGVVSAPSFASEVDRGVPTTLTPAYPDTAEAMRPALFHAAAEALACRTLGGDGVRKRPWRTRSGLMARWLPARGPPPRRGGERARRTPHGSGSDPADAQDDLTVAEDPYDP